MHVGRGRHRSAGSPPLPRLAPAAALALGRRRSCSPTHRPACKACCFTVRFLPHPLPARLMAYIGPAVTVADVVVRPSRSIIKQSYDARERRNDSSLPFHLVRAGAAARVTFDHSFLRSSSCSAGLP